MEVGLGAGGAEEEPGAVSFHFPQPREGRQGAEGQGSPRSGRGGEGRGRHLSGSAQDCLPLASAQAQRRPVQAHSGRESGLPSLSAQEPV